MQKDSLNHIPWHKAPCQRLREDKDKAKTPFTDPTSYPPPFFARARKRTPTCPPTVVYNKIRQQSQRKLSTSTKKLLIQNDTVLLFGYRTQYRQINKNQLRHHAYLLWYHIYFGGWQQRTKCMPRWKTNYNWQDTPSCDNPSSARKL